MNYQALFKIISINSALISGICSLFLVGWAVRSIQHQPSGVGSTIMPPNYKMFHPRLGDEVVPYFDGLSSATGEEIKYKFGALGERVPPGLEQPLKINDDCQMAIFGDSETIGFGLHYHETWPANLEVLSGLKKICNFAVAGYGLDQYYLRYLEKMSFLKTGSLILAYLPHFADDRHMHAYRWGHPKPVFLENEKSGELDLILDHVKPSYSMKIWSTLSRWGDWSSHILPIFRIAERLESSVQQWLFAPTYSSYQVERRAIQIIELFQSSVRESESIFVLVTSLPHLCESVQVDHCLFFKRDKEDQHITKLGDNTLHLNPDAQTRLAKTVFSYLSDKNLLESNH